MTVLSALPEVVKLHQLYYFCILFEDFAGELMEELAQVDEHFGPSQFLRLCYIISVGIDATREGSPVGDFFSVFSGTSAMAAVQALTMNMFITKSLLLTPS